MLQTASHHRARARRVGLSIALSFALASSVGQAQTITAVPQANGDTGAQGYGISANGNAIAVTRNTDTEIRGARWSASRGLEDIGTLGGSPYIFAQGISGNGEVVVGFTWEGRALRWSRARGLEDIGNFPGTPIGAYAAAASFTGNEIAGVAATEELGYHAFRWTPRGMQDLGTLPGGYTSYAYGISGNGEVVTGLADTADFNTVAFRWSGGVMRPLPVLVPGDFAMGFAADGDGSNIAGVSGSNAVIWQGDTLRDLGVLGDGTYAVAYAISANGRVVGAMCGLADYTPNACVWTERLGLVNLNTHLAALGVDLTGWTLGSVTGVSADGSSLTGAGTLNGVSRAWVVHVPSIEGTRGPARSAPPATPHSHDSPARRMGRFPVPHH